MRILITLFTILILIFSLNMNFAQGVPEIPQRFFGFVFDKEGNYVEDNTTITAELNGKYFTTDVKNGKYGYGSETEKFYVNGTSGDVGSIIYFYINGTLVEQYTNYDPADVNVDLSPFFNLSLDSLMPEISNVSVVSVSINQAVINWSTNKLTTSIIHYGKTQSLGENESQSEYLKEHELTLTGLDANTPYYFKILAYDYQDNLAEDDNSGNYYSFTTEAESGGNGGGYTPGGGGSNGDGSDTNTIPTANAGGPYYGKVNEMISFDASKSSDSDGHIVNYTWNFGDGDAITSTVNLIEHAYSIAGNYSITLTVFDNDGDSDSASTYANISSVDTDGDGWTDEAENYYGYDPNDNSSYPLDSDDDGVPDEWDSDDDNDGLTDEEEIFIGSDTFDGSDVIRILNEYGLFFLIDTNEDGMIDKFYKQSENFTTDLSEESENIFLIDADNDEIYDYRYDVLTKSFESIVEEDGDIKEDNNFIIYFSVILIIVITGLVIYLKFRKK